MKGETIRLGTFLGMALITLIGCLGFSGAETNPVAGVIGWLPKEHSGYRVYKGEIGEEEKRWLPADTTFIKRIYVEKGLPEQEAARRAMFATLIVAGSDSRSLHRPQVCLRAQKWTIVKREPIKIQTSGGELEVMDFHLERIVTNGENQQVFDEQGKPVIIRAHYVYWWVGPDASTSSDEMRVWLELWNSILKGRKERWAYPSVLGVVDERYGREEVQERIYKFIEEVAPEFQKSLGAKDRPDAVELKISG